MNNLIQSLLSEESFKAFWEKAFSEKTFGNMKFEFLRYYDNPIFFIIFIIAILFILFYKPKEKQTARIQIGITSLIIMLIIFFPPFYLFIGNFIGEGNGNDCWRLYWMLPSAPAIAYMIITISELFNKDRLKPLKYITLIISLILIILLGAPNKFISKDLEVADNKYKVPEDEFSIIMMLENEENENKKVMAPIDVVPWVRQLSTNIKLMYTISLGSKYPEYVNTYNSEYFWFYPLEDMEKFLDQFIKNGCNYFITYYHYESYAGYFEYHPEKFELIGVSSNHKYKLFKLIEQEKSED